MATVPNKGRPAREAEPVPVVSLDQPPLAPEVLDYQARVLGIMAPEDTK